MSVSEMSVSEKLVGERLIGERSVGDLSPHLIVTADFEKSHLDTQRKNYLTITGKII
jgi:hypothetical protein